MTTSKPRPVPAGRVARMTRMGSMAAAVAGNMAAGAVRDLARGKAPQARDLLLTPGNMRRVTDELAKMRGAAMKVGQLVSMDTGDVLPPELADIMARLRADADFMPPKQLQQVLISEWGAGWQKQFAQFDVRPIAAASIGQVHRARTRDGRDLAIKVQYPGIARSIDSDVANVARLIRLSGLLPAGFDLAPYLKEAKRQLHEEADYQREARCLAEFGTLLQSEPGFVVPALAEDLSTERILAMSYVPSQPIEDVLDKEQALRNQIAEHLVRLMLRELFEFGQMQTDPNFANYRFDPETEQIVLLDFGATRHLMRDVIEPCGALMASGLNADMVGVERAAATLSILSDTTPPQHRARILNMIGLVFDHVRAAPVMDLGDPALSRVMQAEGEALARDGFLPPPVPLDLLYIQRKMGGMFLLASRLRAQLPVAEIMQDYVPGPSSPSAGSTG